MSTPKILRVAPILPPFGHIFSKGRFKGCNLSLKYDADGVTIVGFHLTNKEIVFNNSGRT